jgi:hypothetical protein
MNELLLHNFAKHQMLGLLLSNVRCTIYPTVLGFYRTFGVCPNTRPDRLNSAIHHKIECLQLNLEHSLYYVG